MVCPFCGGKMEARLKQIRGAYFDDKVWYETAVYVCRCGYNTDLGFSSLKMTEKDRKDTKNG